MTSDCRYCVHGTPNGIICEGRPGITCDVFDELVTEHGGNLYLLIGYGKCPRYVKKEVKQ